MFSFLFLTSMAILTLVVGGLVALPVIALLVVLWLVTLPFRLFFGFLFGGVRLILGLIGGLLGLVFLPVALVLGVVGVLVAGLLALVMPILPLVLVFLLGWAVYRFSIRPARPVI